LTTSRSRHRRWWIKFSTRIANCWPGPKLFAARFARRPAIRWHAAGLKITGWVNNLH
jgi:hypothetical protein